MSAPCPLQASRPCDRIDPAPMVARWPQRRDGPSAADAPDAGPRNAGTDALFAAVYDRLRAMAGRRLANAHDALDATALVHELYLRMKAGEIVFAHPSQFLGYAAQAMRHLLIDRARQRLRKRHGGQWVPVDLDEVQPGLATGSAEAALAIDQALRHLAAVDDRAARVVELVCFAGLSKRQAAELLGHCRRTIDRDWRFARAFMKAQLDGAR